MQILARPIRFLFGDYQQVPQEVQGVPNGTHRFLFSHFSSIPHPHHMDDLAFYPWKVNLAFEGLPKDSSLFESALS